MAKKNIREEIVNKLAIFKSQREEAMRSYQAAHGAVQALEQILKELNEVPQEENNGK